MSPTAASVSKPKKGPRGHAMSVKACTVCQKRKGRCSGGTPCEYCAKANRPCIYKDRPVRLPLTRKNVEILERKSARLENLLRTLHPDLNINALLHEDGSSDIRNEGEDSPTGSVSNGTGNNQNIESWDLTDSEEEDGNVKELMEWHEDTSSRDAVYTLEDGTANFDPNTSGSGYIGKSAGATILRLIQKLLNINRDRVNESSANSDMRYNSNNNNNNNSNNNNSSNSNSNNFRNNNEQENDEDDDEEYTRLKIEIGEKQMANIAIRESLIDSYFKTFNVFYPILHEYSFRQQYAHYDEIPDTSHFQMLLRMVVAWGSLCASRKMDSFDYGIFLSARKRLCADMLESGTLEQIQILLLMGNYLQKRGKPNTGYNFLGLAVRMAIGMGLHKELASYHQKSRPTIKSEIRRRVWWVIHLFDSGASLTFGRPAIMADRVVDVKVPLNIDDSVLSPDDPVPEPVEHATPYTAVIAFAKLSVISAQMFERFFLRYDHIGSSTEMADYFHLVEYFDRQLANWRNDLIADYYSEDCADWFIAPRAVCLWREMNFRMLTYKSFLESVSLGKIPGKLPSRYIERCTGVAVDTVKSINDYCEKHSQHIWHGMTWYATYHLFQADLFIILSILVAYQYDVTGFEVQACYNALAVSKSLFEKFQNSNPAAKKCLDTLEKLDGFINVFKARRESSVSSGSMEVDPDATSNLDAELGNKGGNNSTVTGSGEVKMEPTEGPGAAEQLLSSSFTSNFPSNMEFNAGTGMTNLGERFAALPTTEELSQEAVASSVSATEPIQIQTAAAAVVGPTGSTVTEPLTGLAADPVSNINAKFRQPDPWFTQPLPYLDTGMDMFGMGQDFDLSLLNKVMTVPDDSNIFGVDPSKAPMK